MTIPEDRLSAAKVIRRMRFRYNPLHDLESLWWISVFFILARAIVPDEAEPAQSPEEVSEQLRRQREAAERLLCKKFERYDAMVRTGPFLSELWNLHPAVRRLWPALEEARVALIAAYQEVEQDMATREFDPPVGVYNCVQEQFFRIAGHLEDHKIELAPLPGGWRI